MLQKYKVEYSQIYIVEFKVFFYNGTSLQRLNSKYTLWKKENWYTASRIQSYQKKYVVNFLFWHYLKKKNPNKLQSLLTQARGNKTSSIQKKTTNILKSSNSSGKIACLASSLWLARCNFSSQYLGPSEWQHQSAAVASTTPLISYHLQTYWECTSPHHPGKKLLNTWYQYECLAHTTGGGSTAGLHDTDHNILSLAVQLVSSPLI